MTTTIIVTALTSTITSEVTSKCSSIVTVPCTTFSVPKSWQPILGSLPTAAAKLRRTDWGFGNAVAESNLDKRDNFYGLGTGPFDMSTNPYGWGSLFAPGQCLALIASALNWPQWPCAVTCNLMTWSYTPYSTWKPAPSTVTVTAPTPTTVITTTVVWTSTLTICPTEVTSTLWSTSTITSATTTVPVTTQAALTSHLSHQANDPAQYHNHKDRDRRGHHRLLDLLPAMHLDPGKLRRRRLGLRHPRRRLQLHRNIRLDDERLDTGGLLRRLRRLRRQSHLCREPLQRRRPGWPAVLQHWRKKPIRHV